MRHDGRRRVGMLAEYPASEGDMNRGGVVQAVYRLVQALGRYDEIDLLVLTPTPRVTAPETIQVGTATVLFYPQPSHDARFFFQPTLRFLKRVVASHRLELVHAQAHPHFIVPAIRAGVPHVVTIHGVWRNELAVNRGRLSIREQLSRHAYNHIERYYLARSKHVIAITAEIERLVRHQSARARVFRIDNPIDDQFFKVPKLEGGPIVLFVGWFINRKGLHVLFEAAERLIDVIPGLQVRVVGAQDRDPAYVDRLRARFGGLIERGQVVLLGPISQEGLYAELSRAALLCLPSLAESAPMVIAQAMAASTPVVATRVGGIPDMVGDRVTGRLCRPGDAADLAACLQDVLADAPMRRQMGLRGRELAVERYSGARVARKTLDVYLELLGEHDSHPGQV